MGLSHTQLRRSRSYERSWARAVSFRSFAHERWAVSGDRSIERLFYWFRTSMNWQRRNFYGNSCSLPVKIVLLPHCCSAYLEVYLLSFLFSLRHNTMNSFTCSLCFNQPEFLRWLSMRISISREILFILVVNMSAYISLLIQLSIFLNILILFGGEYAFLSLWILINVDCQIFAEVKKAADEHHFLCC